MKQEIPKRKNIRLEEYDYSKTGYYFITLCVIDRREILGRVVGDGVHDVPRCELTDIGRIVESQISATTDYYKYFRIDKYTIMPNHIHMIITVSNENGSSRKPNPTNARIPSFVSAFRRFINKQCGFSIWQSSYYGRIIRNEEEYGKILQYIEENAARWTEDEYYQ